jgi:hypothetical protein
MADRAGPLPLVGRTVGLGGVLDDQQAVPRRQLQELPRSRVGRDRASRVVGIDEDEGACALVDLCAHLLRRRQPAAGFVQPVVARDGTELTEYGRVERVARGGQ